ncbi:MAG: T9SS type A sorting domain-containing protein [Ignavibacteria bacterium]|nr:T9SS type A sorting domain-containing protein [Ignavibacteria bacterium]
MRRFTNLLKTTNAGENWFNVSSFFRIYLFLFFANEFIGWLGLSGGRILNTTNSGSTWNYQGIFNFFNNIEDIKFANSLAVGWAGTGARFKIFKTTNSGNTWGYQIDSSTSKNISFVDSLKGWTGYFGIANTTNGGGIITHINSYSNFIPEDYKLYQNYPNPFNSQTKISFEVKSNSFVKLIIYDIAGREINIWQSNGILLSGRHEFLFDAKGLSSGVYFYKLEARTQDGVVVFSKSKKMILSK